jgi:MoxR-like ATPase
LQIRPLSPMLSNQCGCSGWCSLQGSIRRSVCDHLNGRQISTGSRRLALPLPLPSSKDLPMSSIPETLSADDQQRAQRLVAACNKVRAEVSRVIVGQQDVVEQLLIAILARGHCLLEGVPGLAKTLMVRSLADAMTLSFHRVQFTPDLMPADITGTDIIQENRQTGHRDLVFDKGPIFTQMLLADEINRTPPKTQAALLEAMQEHKVTVGGTTYTLEEPFFVLATQNPIEQEGTYPLPEAQRDRFLLNVIVDYPSRDEEGQIIDRTTSTQSDVPAAVVSGPEILECQSTVRLVPLPPHVRNFVLDLVRSARPKDPGSAAWVREQIDWGPGPRASQQLVLAAKARALLKGRYHVTLEDVEALALPVLRHRIVPTFSAEAEGVSVDDLIRRLLREVPRPDRKLL